MYNSSVTTSFANGTYINLDANDTLNFIIGLSITVITTVRDTIEEKNTMGKMVSVSCDHDVMHLIEYFNSGVPEAIYSNVLQTNASILFAFVEDIVLNESVRGLYLFYHVKKQKNNVSPFDLIVKALEDVHQYYMVYGTDEYRNNHQKHFNRYNEKFLELTKKDN